MLHLRLLITCTNNMATPLGPFHCSTMSSGVYRRPRKLRSPPPESSIGGFVFVHLGVKGQQREGMLRHDRWCRREHQLVLCVLVCKL